MSRIGKRPVDIPQGVKVTVEGKNVKVSGPKGNLELSVRDEIGVEVDGSTVRVVKKVENRFARSLYGLTRTLIANMVKGVSEGFERRLEIVGVGYRAEIKGREIVLNLGYSNPVRYVLPEGVSAVVEKNTSLTIKGTDKQLVGQVASEIRSLRPPEPYKGKGIRYADEVIQRKAGKAGKGAGG